MLQPQVCYIFVHSIIKLGTCTTELISSVVLCGSKCRHHDTIERPLPQPQSIYVLLQEAGNFDKCFIADSVACKTSYLFCKRSLQQCDEDLHSPENIVHALRIKVTELQDRLQ